jgi:predicted enzyme related to lactoylglutathione lyase
VDERQVKSFHLVRQPNGRRPRFLFQEREKSRPASYPIHLDFGTDDREAEIERLTNAGASVVETKVGTNITFTIMRDPEGNPFCVG